MNKCNAEEMTNNLIIVEELKKAGLDFVPIPVLNSDHKQELTVELDRILNELAGKLESNNG